MDALVNRIKQLEDNREQLRQENEERQEQLDELQRTVAQQQLNQEVFEQWQQNRDQQPRRGPPIGDLKAVKPSQFSGMSSEYNPRNWLDRYVIYGDLNNWDDERKCQALRLFLSGPAEIWYTELPEDRLGDWGFIQEQFIAQFVDSNPKWLLEQKLFMRKQEDSESVENYISDMRVQAARLGKSPDEKLTYFVRGLRPEIRSYVIGQSPANLAEAEQKARIGESIALISKSENNPQPKVAMVEEKSFLVDLLKKQTEVLDKVMSKLDNMQRTPPKSSYQNRMVNGKPVCTYCKKIGHTINSCIQANSRDNFRRNMGPRPQIRCHNCAQLGHLARNCRRRPNMNRSNPQSNNPNPGN